MKNYFTYHEAMSTLISQQCKLIVYVILTPFWQKVPIHETKIKTIDFLKEKCYLQISSNNGLWY